MYLNGIYLSIGQLFVLVTIIIKRVKIMITGVISDYPVEKSANFKQYDMGILNPQVLFNLLCTSTYSNPLTTMIQEYMANARDAHREINKEHVPIEITLPTYIDKKITIRDFGPGISVQRMEEVFVYLGGTTKNTNNVMNGGFGIGAKIGFAYTDSFTILSVVDGVEIEYLAFKGEDGLGHIAKLFEKETKEPNGVSIILEIKTADFADATRAVIKCCYFWKTPPIIHNMHSYYGEVPMGKYKGVDLDKMKYIDKDESNFLFKRILGFSEPKPMVVVDRIIYGPLQDSAQIPYKSLLPSVMLFLDNGEVELTINRENLQYNDRTWKILSNVITNFVQKSRSYAISDLIASPSYDLKGLIEYLKSVNVKSIIKTEVSAPWGYYDLVYKPHSKDSLYLEVPPGWTIYKYEIGKKYPATLESVKGRLLLPISDRHSYAINNLKSDKVPLEHAKRCFSIHTGDTNFILHYEDRVSKVDEWIFKVSREIDVRYLSHFPSEKISKSTKEVTFYDVYTRKSTRINVDEIDSNPHVRLVLYPKKAFKEENLVSNLRAALGRRETYQKHTGYKYILALVGNSAHYKMLLKHEQVMSIPDFINQFNLHIKLIDWQIISDHIHEIIEVRLLKQQLSEYKDYKPTETPDDLSHLSYFLNVDLLEDPVLTGRLSFIDKIANLNISSADKNRLDKRRLKYIKRAYPELREPRMLKSGLSNISERYPLLHLLDNRREAPKIKEDITNYINMKYHNRFK